MNKLWRCPVCGRTFAKPNQWHSHSSTNIESHFEARPKAKAIFDVLVARLKSFGPMSVDAVKNSINLVARHHFGSAHPSKAGLRVGFLLHRKVETERITSHEWAGGAHWGHHVKLKNPGDIDEELLAWLKEAYDLAS